MEERMISEREAVLRHSPVELAEHWLLAISGLLLIFFRIWGAPHV